MEGRLPWPRVKGEEFRFVICCAWPHGRGPALWDGRCFSKILDGREAALDGSEGYGLLRVLQQLVFVLQPDCLADGNH